MSTAILHAGSFIHDFNDIVMKVSLSASSTYRRAEFFFYGDPTQKKSSKKKASDEWKKRMETRIRKAHVLLP